jgi:hypothetical protein
MARRHGGAYGEGTMKVAVSGSHGLIGSALSVRLRSLGHDVISLVRGRAGAGEVQWDPERGGIDADGLHGVDTVVHLAGAGVGDHRWSDAYKAQILQSRARGTAVVTAALAALPEPPRLLLSGSAVGYYGVRGDETLTESSGAGSGFLADVCQQWEAATAAADAAGIRVQHLRSGVVLSAAGGALKQQLLPFRLGVGARLGRGDHWLSWITRRDLVSALVFLLEREDGSGPVNVTSPHPVTNSDFTRALGAALHRPAKLVVPRFAMRVAVGPEMTAEFLLASQRALPQHLLDAGFSFTDPSLATALDVALHDRDLVPPPR